MQITVNGSLIDVNDGSTIRDAIKRIGENPEIYIAAVNGQITHENTALNSGDKIDLVKIISGG